MRTRVPGLTAIVIGWLALSSSTANANVTASPPIVDVGGVLIGQSGAKDVMLSGDGEDVDLVIGNCNGATGTFELSDYHLSNLNSARTITVTYTPGAAPGGRGIQTCTVRALDDNNGAEYGSFGIQGTGQIPQQISVADPTTFGSVRYRDGTPTSSASKIVRVNNVGDRPLIINNVTSSSGDYTFTGGISQTINPGQGRDWTVTFNPGGTTTGARDATMTFTSNDPATPSKSIPLTGTATTASIATTPPAIDFGIVTTGSAKTLDSTVTNSAITFQGPLGVTQATISNASNPNWFTFAACNAATCNFSPQISITTMPRLFGIRCAPPANAGVATQTATVTFTSDSDVAANNTLTLTCVSGASDLTTDPQTVEFGPMLVGTQQTKTITIFNNGNLESDLYLSPYGAYASQFVATGPGCGTSGNKCKVLAKTGMVPGAVTITVTLTPTVEAAISASIDVIPSYMGGPPTAGPSFDLAGKGIDRHLDVAGLHITGPLEFPETFRNPFDAPPTKQVPIINTGDYPLQVERIVIDGDDAVWSLAVPFAPFVVDPQSMTTVDVKFTPVLAGKAPPASIRIETDATDQRLVPGEPGVGIVALAGNGKDRNVDMVPGSIDVGETIAGIPARLSITRPGDVIRVVNLDVQRFNVRDIVIEGGDASAFTLQDMNGDRFSPTMIEPGETQYYDVVFDAPYPGEFESTVVIYLDQDPVAQKPVPIYATAAYVNAHGGGGCSTGGTGRCATFALFGLVLLRRRRRR